MSYRLWAACGLLLFAAACGTTKKVADDSPIDLEPIEVTANRDNPYRAAATQYFDLQHTKLEISFDYSKQYLFGKATLKLKPHFYPQKQLVLDAKQFDLYEVSLLKDTTRTALEYSYDSTQITITLPREYTRDETVTLFINYKAKPEERTTGGSAAITSDKGLYFINPKGEDTTKPIQIWTQGETESSSCWFPTIDKPNQKTTQELYITRQKKYVSLANGTLVSTVDNPDGTATDYWRMNLPHAPYLFMFTVGEFEVIKSNWRDVPVTYYLEKDYAKYGKEIFGNTPQMMEFFSQRLGFDYPWPKYAQIIVRDYVSGAMENTSATLHGEFLQRTTRERLDETYEDIISHELFHQWFGDLVTTESWSNIPLNESFATYGEYLWNEYKYGINYAEYKRLENYDKYMEEAIAKNVNLVRFYYDSREDMFDRHSYEKGGLLLHYLRNIVGDEAFFKSLETYLKTNQFKTVEIHQLRLAFESVTGRDLNWFFNQWFLNSGHPVLNIEYSEGNDSAFVKIEQQQNIEEGLVYTLPMKVKIWYGENSVSYPIELTKKEQTFSFPLTGLPDLIDADADRVVLCEKMENKSIANYVAQYQNATGFIAKYEALTVLADSQKVSANAKATLVKALGDPFYILREFAARKLRTPFENEDTVLATLANLAVKDSYSIVRASAITRISKTSSNTKYEALFETAVGDSSYSVSAAAIKALATVNTEKALAVSATFEKEKNQDMATAVADVYSREGDAKYQAYFQTQLKTATGVTKYYMFYYYANFLSRMEKQQVLTGISDLQKEAEADKTGFMMGAGKGSIKRISKLFDDKRKSAESDFAKAEGAAALEIQQNINSYRQIIDAAEAALKELEAKDGSEHGAH